jgi:hypothetical protein
VALIFLIAFCCLYFGFCQMSVSSHSNPVCEGRYSNCMYSGPVGYDRLDILPTWVTTKIFVLTHDQILSYDPRQRQNGEHISDMTCSSLRALSVFALLCRCDYANSSYQSMYSINKYQVTEKGCVSLMARSSINQALRPA